MEKKVSVIIADDEMLASDIVVDYLKAFPEAEILEVCKNGFEAVKAVNNLKPDILFLDIQMPKLTGIEVLELLENKPAVIFTTAYDEYAIKAFELNAVDYLLKPFGEDRFSDAYRKAVDNLSSSRTSNDKYEKLLDNDVKNNNTLTRIVVRKGSSIHVIQLDDLAFIEAQDDYVFLHTKERKFLKQKTMKYYENNLPGDKFVRLHRSFIVNIEFVDKIELFEKDSYLALLKNGERLKVSASGYKNLRTKFNF